MVNSLDSNTSFNQVIISHECAHSLTPDFSMISVAHNYNFIYCCAVEIQKGMTTRDIQIRALSLNPFLKRVFEKEKIKGEINQNFNFSLFFFAIDYKHILKFQNNWILHRRDIASWKILTFGLHYSGAVGKLSGSCRKHQLRHHFLSGVTFKSIHFWRLPESVTSF